MLIYSCFIIWSKLLIKDKKASMPSRAMYVHSSLPPPHLKFVSKPQGRAWLMNWNITQKWRLRHCHLSLVSTFYNDGRSGIVIFHNIFGFGINNAFHHKSLDSLVVDSLMLNMTITMINFCQIFYSMKTMSNVIK